MPQKLVVSWVAYLILLLLFFLKPTWEIFLVMLAVFLILKDIYMYAIELIPMQKKTIDFGMVHSLYVSKSLWTAYFLSLLNRAYVFPFVLTSYFVYILVKQTEVLDLHLSRFFIMTSESFLLVLCLISWILLTYKQDKDKAFTKKHTSLLLSYGYLILSVVLALLTTYMVYTQVDELWAIGVIISIVSWVLLFLVWVLLMEDE